MHAAIALDSDAERIRTQEKQSSEVPFTRKVQTYDPDWAPGSITDRVTAHQLLIRIVAKPRFQGRSGSRFADLLVTIAQPEKHI